MMNSIVLKRESLCRLQSFGLLLRQFFIGESGSVEWCSIVWADKRILSGPRPRALSSSSLFFHLFALSPFLPQEMIEAIREAVIYLAHTHDGARVAMHCLWHGTPKVMFGFPLRSPLWLLTSRLSACTHSHATNNLKATNWPLFIYWQT